MRLFRALLAASLLTQLVSSNERHRRGWKAPALFIDENEAGPFPTYVSTVESDRVKGRPVSYKLSGPGADLPPTGRFTVNEKGIIQVWEALDREEIATYRISVHALLSGEEVEEAAEMVIRVHDVNDNAPEFGPGTVRASVTEGMATGTLVVRLSATDRDDPATEHVTVVYRIAGQAPSFPPNAFSVDGLTGEVTTTLQLDREDVSEFQLTVLAVDCNGAPGGLTGTGTLVVRVTDVNDNAPTFTSSTVSVTVAENQLVDPLLFLFVSDHDEVGTDGWRATYSIVGSAPDRGRDQVLEESFTLHTDRNSNAGVLSLVKPLDYERQSSVELLVTVSNRAPLAVPAGRGATDWAVGTATVVVSIRDVPEGPVFNPSVLRLMASEGTAPGTSLGEFRARDPDSQHGGEIRYALGVDPARWVSMDERSARLSVAGPIDRESPFVHDGLYTFTVLAVQDVPRLCTATGTVELGIIDVNDHAPVLTGALRRAGPEPGPPRLCLGWPSAGLPLTATDADSPDHGPPFSFSVVDEPPGTAALWEVVTLNDTSARLQARVGPSGDGGPPLGTHLLSLLLTDRWGQGEARPVAVRVCRCWGGPHPPAPGEEAAEQETCSPAKVRRPGLSAGTKAAIVASLLTVATAGIVAFLLPRPKRPLRFFNDGIPRGSLVRYNEEGGSEENNMETPASPMSINMETVSSQATVNSPTWSSPRWSITDVLVPPTPK